MLSIYRHGEVVAWSQLWLIERAGAHTMIAVPRLRLSQVVTLELTQRMPFAKVFEAATIEGYAGTMFVVHATFDLYRTAEPDISDFAVIMLDPTAPMLPVSQVITRTAKMLKAHHE